MILGARKHILGKRLGCATIFGATSFILAMKHDG